MMRIPVFARELNLHSITYQKLRIEKYSPLKELVETTPGYYIGDDRIVYREGVGRPGLKRISSQITRNFYTPWQVLKIARKVFSIRLFMPRSMVPLVLGLPLVLGHTIGRKVNKKLSRFPLWRRLTQN